MVILYILGGYMIYTEVVILYIPRRQSKISQCNQEIAQTAFERTERPVLCSVVKVVSSNCNG